MMALELFADFDSFLARDRVNAKRCSSLDKNYIDFIEPRAKQEDS